LIPPGKPGGGKRTVIMREIVNGLMYALSTGCQWRAIPKDLPPKSSVYDYFDLWTYDGTLDRIHHALYQQCREQEQRDASPTAAIIDTQLGCPDSTILIIRCCHWPRQFLNQRRIVSIRPRAIHALRHWPLLQHPATRSSPTPE
jgi:transposase